MKKNLLMSVLVIVIAAALINIGTMSYFSDPERIDGNVLTAGDLDLKFVGPGEECYLALSFLDEDDFRGVDDPDGLGFSTGDNRVDLGISQFSIFGGAGIVYAKENGDDDQLTHRGTRGLGVYGQEHDEIDNREGVGNQEKIFIEFDTPHWLCKFEVRSLFSDEGENDEPEEGDVRLWLDGEEVDDFHFEGDNPGGNGAKVVDVPDYFVDKIMFHVDQENEYSEFAPARLYFRDLCMDCDDYYEVMGATWEMHHMKPGMEDDGMIVFNEDGSNRGNYLHFGVAYGAYEDDDGNELNGYVPGPEPDSDLNTGANDASNDTFAGFMQITEMTYNCDSGAEYDILSWLTDLNGNGWIDLYDLRNNPQTVDLNDNGVNGDYLTMTIKFHPIAGNDYQGDIFNLVITFRLRYQ